MGKIGYKISARTTILLGREGVSKADSAIVELIKNTYDADADLCILCIDNDNDKIYLFDNGTGMSAQTIINCWMVIGTANKRENYESTKKRIKSGEKGIGRFALDRLGSKCTMYTKNNSSDKLLRWMANWGDFEDASKTLDQIGADLDEISCEYSSVIPNFLKAAIDEAVDRIYKDSGNKVDAYRSGTLFVISELRDNWDSNLLKKLMSGLGTLLPPSEQREFYLGTMRSSKDNCKFVENIISDDYDYKIHAEFDGDKFSITWKRNEFDLHKIPKEVFEREKFQIYPYRKIDFENAVFNMDYEIGQLLKTSDAGLIKKIKELGSFTFDYIFMKAGISEKTNIFYYKEIGKNRRAWLDSYGGIKLYRDNFFVRPYGDPSADAYDWLGLDSRRARNPKSVAHKDGGWSVSNRQSQGTIFISRLANNVLLDKSSREGIIENEYFSIFKNVIIAIISVFERDRAYIAKEFKMYDDEKNDKIKTKEEGKNIAKSILNKSNKHTEGSKQTKEETLAKAVEIYEEERKDLLSEIQQLKILATNGLITSTVVHDLKSLNAILGMRAKNLEKAIKRSDEESINRQIGDLKMNDEFLKSWLTIVSTEAGKDKRTRKKVNIYKIIAKLVKELSPILRRKNIDVNIQDDGYVIERKIFISDFETIFYNLIINSIEAFEKVTSERKIFINMYSDAEKIYIEYSDNGPGISKIFKNPYDIFTYGTTSKKDKDGNDIGTGMGMYIVASTLREYSATYNIIEGKDGFNLNIQIPR